MEKVEVAGTRQFARPMVSGREGYYGRRRGRR